LQLYNWLARAIAGQARFNLIAIYFLWGNLLWLVAYAMGWLLRRKNHAFLAALPALTLLVGVIGNTRLDTSGLIIALSALLAMTPLLEHLKREWRWENSNIDYSEELRLEIIGITIPIVALVMIVSSLVPRISIENIRSFFNPQPRSETISQVDFSESLGLDQVPYEPIAVTTQPGMPRSHLIGSGPELSDITIMEIDTGEIYLPPQADPQAELPKFYWYSCSYDIYSGSGWTIDEVMQGSIPAQQEIHIVESPIFYPILHTVRKTSSAPPNLYFPGMLHSVDQNLRATWHGTTGEFIAAELQPLAYTVSAYGYDLTVEALIRATDTPPDLVQETYLQLPPELPTRVLNLASSITETASTPYEKAKRIETFLRQYEYTLDLPAPPENQDLVDYFLFDLKKGYCDYYASAMVVMARAVGLPARLAIGYSTGTYDYTRQVFVVTEANAHAWPQIYIEPIGWVPFEPTASLSAELWADESQEVQPPIEPIPPSQVESDGQEFTWQDALGFALLLLLILLIGYLWLSIVRRKRKIPSPTAQIETIYQKMCAQLTQNFYSLPTEHTPSEFCRVYTEYFQQMRSSKFTRASIEDLINHIQIIINLHERGVYSSKKLVPEHIKSARSHLFQLRIRAWSLKAAQFLINS